MASDTRALLLFLGVALLFIAACTRSGPASFSEAHRVTITSQQTRSLTIDLHGKHSTSKYYQSDLKIMIP